MNLNDHSPQSLTSKLLARPRLLEHLAKLLRPGSMLACYSISDEEMMPAQRLSLELEGTWLSSHPGELPPEVLPEPYVTLSRHTAPIIHSPQHRHLASAQTGLIVAA